MTAMLRKKKILESTELIVEENNRKPCVDKLKPNQIKTKCWSLFLGAFYTFLGSITVLLSNVIVKKLTYIDTGQLSLLRNFGVLIFNLPIAIYYTDNIFGPRKYVWLMLARGIFGATALYLNLLSYRYLPLTETSIILSTIPAFVTIIARLHLKEPCGLAQMVSIALIFLGVLVSIRLPEVLQNRSKVQVDKYYIFGLSCAVGCVLILSFIMIAIRKMRNVHFSVLLIYFGGLGAIENAVITYFTAGFELPYCEGFDRIEILLIGVLGFMSHCFLTLALQKEVAGVVSTIKAAFDIILSTILDYVFFNTTPDAYTISSGLLVTVAISTLGIWKWLKTQQSLA